MHDAQLEIKRFRGRFISTMRGEIFAAFDGPARAIRAACALMMLNSQLACGLHTGECDTNVNGDLRGHAVEFARRIAFKADSNQVVVSNTVRDLVAGSGIAFQLYGMLRFDEAQDERQLFAVEHATCN